MSGPTTSGPLALGALDLAALLCSRVCHDLISPVGAIVNGLEVLDEDKDEETRTFALDLIKKSAHVASAKLQFCRLAFGAAGLGRGADRNRRCGEGGARPPGRRKDQDRLEPAARVDAEEPSKAFVEHAAGWRRRHSARGNDHGRSGRRRAGLPHYLVRCSTPRLTPTTTELLIGSPSQTVDAHGIQPFYTGILARDCGFTIGAWSKARRWSSRPADGTDCRPKSADRPHK